MQRKLLGAGEMAPWLLATLAEDPGSTPSLHRAAQSHLQSQFRGTQHIKQRGLLEYLTSRPPCVCVCDWSEYCIDSYSRLSMPSVPLICSAPRLSEPSCAHCYLSESLLQPESSDKETRLGAVMTHAQLGNHFSRVLKMHGCSRLIL